MANQRILIAEDDLSVRIMISRLIQAYTPSAEVVTTSSGVDALSQFQKQGADLLITDLMMPNMDGWSLIQAIRAEKPTMPVVVLSGDTMEAQALAEMEDTLVLSKPFRLAEFQMVITAALAS